MLTLSELHHTIQDARKLVKKDKGPVSKSEGQAKKKRSKGEVHDKLSILALFDKAMFKKL